MPGKPKPKMRMRARPKRKRHGPRVKTTHLAELGGGLAMGYGLLLVPASDGSTTASLLKSNGPSAAAGRLLSTVQPGGTLSSNSYYAPARGATIGGALLILGNKAAKAMGIHLGFRISRKRRVNFLG